MPAYREDYIQHRQQTLFQVARLNNSDTLLVFLHGIGDSHLNFLEFFERRELNDYDIIIADLLGYGRSTATDYSFKNQCAGLEAQLKNIIEKYKTVVFVPHSMGGIHATMLAKNAFKNALSGIFAIETTVMAKGSFISEQVVNAVKSGADFSKWYAEFCKKISDDAQATNSMTLRHYLEGLQLAKEQAFCENAIAIQQVANKIGIEFTKLPIPKAYCMGDSGKKEICLSFLQQHKITTEVFPTASHWVAQACRDEFCMRLREFVVAL